MNYSEYKVLKDNLTRASRVLAFVPLVLFGGLIFQLVMLLFKTQTKYDYLNFSIIDQLFSNGFVYGAKGNMIMSILFYGATFLCVVLIAACVFMAFKKMKLGYRILIVFYIIDLVISVLSLSVIHIAIHVVILFFLFQGYSVCKKIEKLPKNIWGYDE